MNTLADALNQNMVRRKNIIPNVDKARTPAQVQKGVNLWNRDSFDRTVAPRTLSNSSYYKGQPIRSFKKGGLVHQTGPAYLHKGELVVPKYAVDKMHRNWMLSSDGAMDPK